MLVDIERVRSGDVTDLIIGIGGDMGHFELCCSTGVVKDIRASEWREYNRTGMEAAPKSGLLNRFRNYPLHCTLRAISHLGTYYPLPLEAGPWYVMSLMYTKLTTGLDDWGVGGYKGYKVGQFVTFDRVTSEKRSGKRFNNYNTTFSCDQFAEWLYDINYRNQSKFGEVLLSEPAMGAHGARVRGMIYTPNEEVLRKFVEEKTALVYDYLDHCNEYWKQQFPDVQFNLNPVRQHAEYNDCEEDWDDENYEEGDIEW